MAEIKFCLKALLFAVLIVLFLQIPAGFGGFGNQDNSIESHIHTWIRTSRTVQSIEQTARQVAAGGAAVVRNFFLVAKQAFENTLNYNSARLGESSSAEGRRSSGL